MAKKIVKPVVVAEPVVVADANPFAAMAQTFTDAPVAPPAAPVQHPRAVVQRGGGTYSACTLGAKKYNVTAPHNVAAWKAVQKCLTEHGGTAAVAQLCAAIAAEPDAARCGKPSGMVAYLVKVRALASVA
jgi:hypothetical protein